MKTRGEARHLQSQGERPGADPSHTALGRNPPSRHLGLLSSRTLGGTFLWFKLPSCGTWLGQPWDDNAGFTSRAPLPGIVPMSRWVSGKGHQASPEEWDPHLPLRNGEARIAEPGCCRSRQPGPL